ncbi:D-alanyl-D-alanine carboxypeptidase (penicillin-binding protein 5/6) [Streptomyces sp. V3I8]|uniref:D-alanyl-D-alanine carboxypeptidase n=1 Tax=Streptomyces sp. V3I8 TaxID=3042279 RepID=UPI0027851060|nr:D-alanyl-D-alanine carboxypeptidase [Streptomyces sp. V3I8]MDQ1036883.1 D-alanyl-D-alanine carboxypeptidase (penicillin-binding protein 5/6) [Streptomyces sp. V3I8]
MAGEFPDRSKQHESSAEPTSGSKASVPDPRLAVSRDPVTAAARTDTGPAAGRPDTATAVFSTRRVTEAASSAGSAAGAEEPDAGSPQGSDGSAKPEPTGGGTGKGAGGGDGRLRGAAAALAATADEEAPGGAPEGAGADAGGKPGARGAGRGSTGRDSAGGSGPDADDAGSKADGGDLGGDSGSAGSDAEPQDAVPGVSASAEDAAAGDAAPGGSLAGPGAGSGTDAGSESVDAVEADVPAEDVESVPAARTATGTTAKPGGDADADTDVDTDADADAESKLPGEAAGAAKSAPKTDTGAGTAAGAGAGAGAGAKAVAADGTAQAKRAPRDAALPDAAETDIPAEDAVPETGTDPGTDADPDVDVRLDAGTSATDQGAAAKADAEPKGETPAADRSTAAVKADVKPEEGVPEAAASTAGAPKSAARAASDGDKAPAAKSASGAGADAARKPAPAPDEDAAADTDTDTERGHPADQATAIFKRPPAVDRPTAMLKLGGAAKAGGDEPAGKPGAGVDTPTGAESAAEPDSGTGTGTAAKTGGKATGGEATGGEAADGKADGDKATDGKADGRGEGPAEAERTSRFVALKPLDEPAPPKAKPAGPAGPSGVAPASETAVVPQVGPERTSQQPLPPRPPLDLLAELTNTPLPRQTPVRTIVRRVKIWTPLVLLLAVVFAVVQAVRPLPTPTLTLTADESYAFEGSKVSLPWPEEGQGWMDVNGLGTVDSFGDQEPVAIGSVAKAMTAYVILKEHPLKAGADGAKIPVDAKAEKEGGYDAQGESTLNTIKDGDTLTEKDAIAAIMIPSANNVARLLARWDAGSEAKFTEKMNAAAKDLGMKNTTYTDPSGLKETTVSTAEDQVKLGNELVRIKALVDITKLPTWTDPSGRKWDNYNRLVPYNNAIGIKTGSTTKAGGNLLFAATQEVGGENVIVVGAVLGQHTPPIIDTVNAVSKTAMIAAQEALTSRKILKKGDVVGYVDDGLGGRTPVVATKDVSAVGWAGKTVKLKLDEDGKAIPHEAKAGTEVGSLSVGGGTTGDAVEVPVALRSDLTEPGFGAKLTRVA